MPTTTLHAECRRLLVSTMFDENLLQALLLGICLRTSGMCMRLFRGSLNPLSGREEGTELDRKERDRCIKCLMRIVDQNYSSRLMVRGFTPATESLKYVFRSVSADPVVRPSSERSCECSGQITRGTHTDAVAATNSECVPAV
jgi:hypothetical protein